MNHPLNLCQKMSKQWGNTPRPNVIFIMTDQQFAEAMSCRIGNQFLNTPAMDNLAANGMLFTRAYTSNPLCMPARISLFTGRYPHEIGGTWNEPPAGGLDTKEFISMGTYFKNSGYETAYYGQWDLFFDQKDVTTHGFDNQEEPEAGKAQDNGPDVQAADAAVKFITRKHEKPFFMVVSFHNPHNICQWVRRAAGRQQVLDCGEIGNPPSLDQLPPAPFNIAPPKNEPDGISFMRKIMQVDGGTFPVAKFTPDDWRRQRWAYYRMIELVDKEIGRVMEALQKAGMENNTLVVFTSDHGECGGAHSFNQKEVFYEESVHVPLIITWKGKTVGGTADKLVNTGIDILPALLDCAGLESPKKLPGRSLWPLAIGKTAGKWREYIVAGNDMRAWEAEGKPRIEGRMLRTDRYKYCIYSKGNQRESLVDLQEDPGETVNLAKDPSYKKVILKHRKLLAGFGKEHNDPLINELLANDVEPRPLTKNIDTNSGGK